MASVNESATSQWLQSLIEPGFILSKAMSYYIDVNLEAIFHHGQVLAPFTRSRELRDEAFGRFWVAFSSNREEVAQEQAVSTAVNQQPTSTTTTTPLIDQTQPQVQGSADLIPPILAQASGVVLDVGPGTGTQMPLLRSPAIKTIYGAEPCVGLHAELRARAIAEGLADKYRILPCSVVATDLVPALQREGVVVPITSSGATITRTGLGLGGVFDTIICVRVLCSVPELEKTAQEIYALLKPGGKLLVVEHVVNPWWTPKGSIIARAVQAVYHFLGWRWVMGDCCLNRNTERALKRVALKDGGWESVELEPWFSRTPMPYIAGVLVKKST